MNGQELERRIADAVARTAPDDLEGVLSRCETRKGNVIQMTTKKKRPAVRALIAACLALVLVGGGGGVIYQQNYAVASVVSLDVNPSIELNVNKNERVLSCVALNDQAAEVLADMDGGADLEGTKLDVAVNAIVGALVRSGYLDSISSAILISVEDRDQSRAAKLQQELTAVVDVLLQERASDAAVLSQTVERNAELARLARESSISTGKASLIERVMALNGALTFDALAALSVEELKDLVETGAPGMPIGREKAAWLAEEYAGTLALDSVTAEVDAELDDTPPHYEVELRTHFGEFEYRVDAYTGAILRGRENVLADQAPTPTPAVTPSDTPAVPPSVTPSDTPSDTPAVTDVGSDGAKAAALAHAGLAESEVTRLRVEKDYDDGRLEYEVEFRAGGMEYEYTIDAATGAVLEHEKDWDD